MKEYAITVLIQVLKGDDIKEVIRKYISYPLNKGDSGTIIHYTSVDSFIDILEKAKKFDALKKIIKEMFTE